MTTTSEVIMPRFLACILLAVPLAYANDAARPGAEDYEVALLDGARVGNCHISVHKHEDKQLRVTSSLVLNLKRYNTAVKLRMDEGTIESLDGKVLAVFMTQEGGKKLTLTGAVIDEDKLYVNIDNGKVERRIRWSSSVLGLKAQELLISQKKPKPGEKFSFERYEPTYNTVLTVRGVMMPAEEVDVLGTKRKLLRIELTPDEVKAVNATVRPPKAVWWVDDEFVVVRRQVELEGLGVLTLVRTTKEKALAPFSGAVVDIGKRSLVKLDRAIAKPYDTRAVIYSVRVRDSEDAAALFVYDAHQSIREAKGDRFELRIQPVQPGETAKEVASAEYLGTSHFIDHEDARIRDLTRKAILDDHDAWGKAKRIERFVKNHMRLDNAAELVPASQVAKNLRGDCRHHAFLTAAMCRAARIPARTAIGLLYVTRDGPTLGFHTWVEVLVEGQWIGIDSTLGKGGVSATHVKITQHSWHETQSLTPLLPVSRVIGKMEMKVLRVE